MSKDKSKYEDVPGIDQGHIEAAIMEVARYIETRGRLNPSTFPALTDLVKKRNAHLAAKQAELVKKSA